MAAQRHRTAAKKARVSVEKEEELDDAETTADFTAAASELEDGAFTPIGRLEVSGIFPLIDPLIVPVMSPNLLELFVPFLPVISCFQTAGINKSDLKKLREGGFFTVESIAYSSRKAIHDVKGVGEKTANKVIVSPAYFALIYGEFRRRR